MPFDNQSQPELSKVTLSEILHYDPNSGVFTWKVKPNRRIKIGDEAGSLTKQGYLKIKISGVDHKAHRLAWLYMTGEWPSNGIDHKDNVKTHNWFANLRPATQSQNMANCGAHRNNSTGFKGVSYHSQSGKWTARIRHNGIRHNLGIFKTPEIAFAAYCKAAKKYHGEFANVDCWGNHCDSSVQLIAGRVA